VALDAVVRAVARWRALRRVHRLAGRPWSLNCWRDHGVAEDCPPAG
jgi:hypothetical protein